MFVCMPRTACFNHNSIVVQKLNRNKQESLLPGDMTERSAFKTVMYLFIGLMFVENEKLKTTELEDNLQLVLPSRV